MLITYSADNSARGAQARLAAEAVNAGLVLQHYRVMSNPTILIGTTTTKINLGADTTFMVNGNIVTKSTTADFWTLGGATSATTVAVGSLQRYALLSNAAGTAFAYEATQVLGSDSSLIRWSNVAGNGRYRAIQYWASQGLTLLGSLQIITDATHTFIPGTTALDATGITRAFTSGIDATVVPLIGNETGLAIGTF